MRVLYNYHPYCRVESALSWAEGAAILIYCNPGLILRGKYLGGSGDPRYGIERNSSGRSMDEPSTVRTPYVIGLLET